MLSRAAFAVVLVNDKSPWLVTGLEAFRYVWNGISRFLGGLVVVIECLVNFTTLVVSSLELN